MCVWGGWRGRFVGIGVGFKYIDKCHYSLSESTAVSTLCKLLSTLLFVPILPLYHVPQFSTSLTVSYSHTLTVPYSHTLTISYSLLSHTSLLPFTLPPPSLVRSGPVHFTTGSAGCSEIHDHFMPEQPYWSAIRSIDYGYTRLTAHNKTHVYWEQVSDDKVRRMVSCLFNLFHIY